MLKLCNMEMAKAPIERQAQSAQIVMRRLVMQHLKLRKPQIVGHINLLLSTNEDIITHAL